MLFRVKNRDGEEDSVHRTILIMRTVHKAHK